MVATTITEDAQVWCVAITDESGNLKQKYNGRSPERGYFQLFATEEERNTAFPEIVAQQSLGDISEAKQEIDVGSGVNIAEAHSNKAEEARRVKFDGIDTTDPIIIEQLVYLAPEASSRGIDIAALADIVWAKHKETAAMDNLRIAAKLAVA